MAENYDHLLTTVKNTSGGERFFGFLPPHGVRLAADEEFTLLGSAFDAVARGRGTGPARRYVKALFESLEAGSLAVTSVPSGTGGTGGTGGDGD